MSSHPRLAQDFRVSNEFWEFKVGEKFYTAHFKYTPQLHRTLTISIYEGEVIPEYIEDNIYPSIYKGWMAVWESVFTVQELLPDNYVNTGVVDQAFRLMFMDTALRIFMMRKRTRSISNFKVDYVSEMYLTDWLNKHEANLAFDCIIVDPGTVCPEETPLSKILILI
jgi:hypothetical protein